MVRSKIYFKLIFVYEVTVLTQNDLSHFSQCHSTYFCIICWKFFLAWNCFDSFIKNHWPCICITVPFLVSLLWSIYLFLFILTPHCLNHCNFIISLEIRWCEPSNFFFFKRFFVTLGLSLFSIFQNELVNFYKNYIGRIVLNLKNNLGKSDILTILKNSNLSRKNISVLI